MTIKKVLVGICGSIAAYKSAELVRLLKKRNIDVRVVMTTSATEFITPMTLQVLSQNDVRHDVFNHEDEAKIDHISLARWADVIVIAPATANTLAKIAHGMADDLLTTICLATNSPIVIAPAMNQAMWANAITQKNLDALTQHGMTVLSPDVGEQACGEVGAGRMPEPQSIVNALLDMTADVALTVSSLDLTGKRILITAGPTREAIDPVRFLSNHSSGKMGFAIADAAANAGADVTLVAGPVSLTLTHPNITRIDITSAQELHDVVHRHIDAQDWFIATAAVSDYRVEDVAEQKMKKQGDGGLTLHLVQNPDVLKSVCDLDNRPLCVGFAAETDNILAYAKSKRQRKGADLICVNDVSDSTIGFNSDENQLTVIGETFERVLPKMSKRELGIALLETLNDFTR